MNRFALLTFNAVPVGLAMWDPDTGRRRFEALEIQEHTWPEGARLFLSLQLVQLRNWLRKESKSTDEWWNELRSRMSGRFALSQTYYTGSDDFVDLFTRHVVNREPPPFTALDGVKIGEQW